MIGNRLAHYRITALIGTGGMATVYRAHDEKLGRDIALKLISPELLVDPTAAARLLREARAAAQLNHPNICAIYEVGEADGHPYIALELVDGTPLSESISPGGMPPETVLRLGAQIADALAHAHEHGVIHRDLKGSNVVISRQGRAKVLDFGLARRSGTEPIEDDRTLTETGMIAGTPQYLAPELLRGGGADARSDVWALGVVLYEMASGEHPFRGRTRIETSAAILNEPARPLPPRVPPGLRAVIQHCLEKDPEQRFRQAAEVRAALDALQSDSAAEIAVRPVARRRMLVTGLVLASLLAAGVTGWLLTRHPAEVPDLKQEELTSNPDENPVGTAMLSPDGKYLAYTDSKGVHLRLLETGDVHDLALPPGMKYGLLAWADWYPDGTRLLMSSSILEGKPAVWSVPISGGVARKLIDDGAQAVISPDGRQIAYTRQGLTGPEIWCADVDGGAARRIVSSDSSATLTIFSMAWSPRGNRLAYACSATSPRGELRLWLESCDLAGHRVAFLPDSLATRLHALSPLAWLPDGRVLFALFDRPPNQTYMNLWALRVDPASGVSSGPARQITHWLRTSIPGLGRQTADGKRLAVTLIQYPTDVYVGDIASLRAPLRAVRRFTLDNRDDDFPSWAPDSRSVVFTSDQNGSFDVFRQGLDASSPEIIVAGPGDQYAAQFSPDGKWILYWDSPSGFGPAARLMRVPMDGGAPSEVMKVEHRSGFRRAPGPPPRYVLYESGEGTGTFSTFDPASGQRAVVRRAPGEIAAWDLSPDGRKVVTASAQDLSIIDIGGG